MSNPFYNYSGSFIPGTLARAEAVASEFQSVQAGFADLATEGVDTGTASAYVVTTQGSPAAPLADGNLVSFKAGNTNSGPATLNANATGAISILRFNGTPLQAGDISAHAWYTLTYNSTYNAWTLPGASVITFSGSISSASPPNKVGLVAAAGVSTAAAPIDTTFAIDQTIAPTWTGLHTWTAANNSYGVIINGGAAAGQSFGLQINAGSNATDSALTINSQAGAALLKVRGDGGLVLGVPTGGDRGAGTINAAGAIYVNNSAVPTVGGTNTFSANNAFSAGIAVTGTATFSGPTTANGTFYVNAAAPINGGPMNIACTILTLASQVVVTSTATFNNSVSIQSGLSVAAPSNNTVAVTVTGTLNGAAMQYWTDGTNTLGAWTITGNTQIGSLGTSGLQFLTNSLNRMAIGATGGVTIASPVAGVTSLTINGDNFSATPFVINSISTSGSIVAMQINNAGAGVNSGAVLQLGTNYYGTGTTTATFSATNKPGGSNTSPDAWVAIFLNNTKHYMPAWQ